MGRKNNFAGWLVLILTIAMPAGAVAQNEELSESERKKKLKDEAQRMIKEFRDDFNDAKSEAGKAGAVRKLAETEHSLVVSELMKMLKVPLVSVRREAAAGLGRYKNNPQLSDILLRYAAAEKDEGVVVAILEAVGDVSACRGVKRLPNFYDKSIAIASKAFEASGVIKSRDLVPSLIKEMGKLERMGENIGIGFGGIDPVSRAMEDDGKKRRDALLPKVKEALEAITGQSLGESKEYETWWKANARTFRDPDDLRIIEERERKKEEQKAEYKRKKEELKRKEEEKKNAREERK